MAETDASDHTAGQEMLARKLEVLELEQRKRDAEAVSRPQAKPWWASAVEFLALPAAVLALVAQFTATVGTTPETEKTQAETVKIRTEEVKTRAELEGLLNELAEKKRRGVESYRAEIEKTLPRLEETLAKLKAVDDQSRATFVGRILPKYILLWILFNAVSLVMDIVTQIWSTLLGGIAIAIFSRGSTERLTRDEREWWRKVHRTTQWIFALLAPVPNILRWSIQLSIFLALMLPLFNETTQVLGSALSFSEVVDSARRLDLQGALEQMHAVLFGRDAGTR